MKVTINPTTGEVSFDVDTVDQALEIARSVKVEDTPTPTEKSEPVSVPIPEVSNSGQPVNVNVTQAEYFPDVAADLVPAYYETWEFLYRHDGVQGGVTISAVARALHLKTGTANQRLCHLVNRGYARRVKAGRYEWALP